MLKMITTVLYNREVCPLGLQRMSFMQYDGYYPQENPYNKHNSKFHAVIFIKFININQSRNTTGKVQAVPCGRARHASQI